MKRIYIYNLICLLGIFLFTSCSPILARPTETPTPSPLPTLSPPTAIPTTTSTATQAPPTSTPTPEPTPTVHGMVSPAGIIPAGMPAIVDGYVLVVDKSGLLVDGDFVGFTIQLSIIGDEAKLFRYNVSSIRLKDDLGNYYDYVYNVGYSTHCNESDIYNPKQLMIEPNDDVIIKTETGIMYTSYPWCIDSDTNNLPGFRAVIPSEAKTLILEFEGFGPFSGFGVEFNL